MPIPLLLAITLHAGRPDADTTVRLARGTSVEINADQHGDVTVRTGTDDIVTVRGGRLRVHGSTASVNGDGRRGLLEVTVPPWVRLDVSSFNGNITFTGTPARVHAETVAGEIVVKGGSGNASLESVNGNISVNDFRGERLSIDATAGEVTVNGGSGAFNVESVNGGVHLLNMRASEVHASSINEVVEYSGSFDPRGTYELASHNGGINLWLPADVSARMKISTFNGEFTSPDIPATTNGTRSDSRQDIGKDKGNKGSKGSKGTMDEGDQEFTVTFGKGDASVTLDSFNGDITVRRYRPR